MSVQVGEPLEAADVVLVAGGAPVAFGDRARARVAAARAVIDEAVASGETIYGVTTGFGALAHTRVEPAQASTLQHGIVRSHATAVGAPLSTRGSPRDAAAARPRARARPLGGAPGRRRSDGVDAERAT